MWSHPQGAVHMVAGIGLAVKGMGLCGQPLTLSVVFICTCTVVCMIHSSFRTFTGSCVTLHPEHTLFMSIIDIIIL